MITLPAAHVLVVAYVSRQGGMGMDRHVVRRGEERSLIPLYI